MEKNEIDIYLHTILKKQLQKLKVSNYGLYAIIGNVRNQLSSIVKHWNDDVFIDAIFSTVVEEGHFYEPYISDRIGNLVVLGIRNSLLEIAASVSYKEYGLNSDLKEKDIQWITSSAIEYFKSVDMNLLSEKIELEDDYYNSVIQKYRIAYFALVQLGKCSGEQTEIEFEEIAGEPFVLEEILNCTEDINLDRKVKDIVNGISEELAPGLVKLLKGILDKNASIFYVDSFKCLSRNFETNLKVLQFLLTHDAIFLTNNFLISNGYVSRRRDYVRASHENDFNIEAIQSIGEVSKKYKDELEKLAEEWRK